MRYGRKLYQWQADILDAIDPAPTLLPAYVAAITANESGKSSEVIPSAVYWHMDCIPGSQVVMTTASARQLRAQVFPELRRRFKAEGLEAKGWTIRDSNIFSIKAPNGSTLEAFATDNPGIAEGYHAKDARERVPDYNSLRDEDIALLEAKGITAENHPELSLLYIIDEAKTVDRGIFTAINRCNAARILMLSSADHFKPEGYFYDAFHTNSWKWNLFNVSYDMCPHLMTPMRERERLSDFREWGIESSFIQSKWFARFPQSALGMVFNMANVAKCMSNTVKQWGKERRVAVDLSLGGDGTPVYVRDGNTARRHATHRQRDATELADVLIQDFRALEVKPEWVTVDCTGMGQPILDVLNSKGWMVNGINFGGKPRNPRLYRNVRTEMYINLNHRINSLEIALPSIPELRSQMTETEYETDDKLKISLKPKKDMPVSPDDADTVAMLFYDAPRLEEREAEELAHQRRLSPTMSNKSDDWRNRRGQEFAEEEDGGYLY